MLQSPVQTLIPSQIGARFLLSSLGNNARGYLPDVCSLTQAPHPRFFPPSLPPQQLRSLDPLHQPTRPQHCHLNIRAAEVLVPAVEYLA